MQTYLKFTRNLVAILSLLTVFGCGADPTTSSNSSSNSVVAPTDSLTEDDATTSTSESKSNFVATLLGGQTFDSQKVLENQPLALWFWAPGWRACKSESSSVEAAYKTWQGKVQITGVAWNGDPGSMQDFVIENNLSFANINDGDGDVFARFNVPYQPAWVFIAKDGTVTSKIGVLSDLELEQELTRLATS